MATYFFYSIVKELLLVEYKLKEKQYYTDPKGLEKEAAERKKIHFSNLVNKRISVLMETEFKGRSEDFSKIKVNKALKPGEIYHLTTYSFDSENLIARLNRKT